MQMALGLILIYLLRGANIIADNNKSVFILLRLTIPAAASERRAAGALPSMAVAVAARRALSSKPTSVVTVD